MRQQNIKNLYCLSGDVPGKYFRNPQKKIKGTYHLFKNWNNHGIIKTTNNKVYKIENINFNIRNNRYESKIGNDSIFILDLENIDYVTINYRKLKSFYFSENGTYKRDQDVNKMLSYILKI